ncbi:hypothetical protein MHYP_G00092780 [Metynnis hypsauchen]
MVEDVLLVVGEQVGCENIYSASRMNKAVVVFLVTESSVSRLIESGIWVKENMIQVFMFSNRRIQSLEASFRCKHGDGSYIVFASTERLRCFECGDISHKQFGCLHRAAQQVCLDTDQADT